MRLGRFWNKVKGVFGRIGKGVKKGVGWVADKAKKAYGWAKENIPKIADTARKVLNVLPQNKYTDKAKDIVNSGEGTFNKFRNKTDEITDRGRQIHDVIKTNLVNK